MKIKESDVGRKIDRIMTIKLVFEKELLNLVSAYEQQ